jgi:hypothetical protein
MQKTVTVNIGIQLAEMSKINFWPSTYHHCKKYNLLVFFVHDKYFITRRPIWNDGNLQSHNSTSVFFLLSFQEGKRERKTERKQGRKKRKERKEKIKIYILLERHASVLP